MRHVALLVCTVLAALLVAVIVSASLGTESDAPSRPLRPTPVPGEPLR